MRVRTNVRFTSRPKRDLFIRKSQVLTTKVEVGDDAVNIIKETTDYGNSDRSTTSYLVENLRGIREEMALSPHPRRICPITSLDYEE